MPLQDKKNVVRRICFDGIFTACAMIFSYVEAVLPLSFLLPFPGVSIGLANLVVLLAFYLISPFDAAAISFIRILLSALLFGSPVSFCFSLAGGAFSFIGIIIFSRALKKGRISFIGMSASSAVLHCIGQIFAAMLFYTLSAFFYLPFLVLAGVFTGALNGLIANLLYKRLENVKIN